MRPALFQKMCYLVGGLLAVGVLHYIPTNVFVISKNLQAAVGHVSVETLRLWQMQGGFTHELRSGVAERDVLLIQKLLATDRAVYPEGKMTGYFGPATKKALTRFQEQYYLPITGRFDEATRLKLNYIFFDQLCPVPAGPGPDFSFAHITREKHLPQDYIPPGLMDISDRLPTIGITCTTEATAVALDALFAAARANGTLLKVCSGYRGPMVQTFLFQKYVLADGQGATNEVASPNHSEHQTGMAIDLTGATNGYSCAADNFGNTPEFRWLSQNAWKYGFNLSYPQTLKNGAPPEYKYEPWHWRYVGLARAEQLYHLGISYNEIDSLQAALFSLTVASTTREVQ